MPGNNEGLLYSVIGSLPHRITRSGVFRDFFRFHKPEAKERQTGVIMLSASYTPVCSMNTSHFAVHCSASTKPAKTPKSSQELQRAPESSRHEGALGVPVQHPALQEW